MLLLQLDMLAYIDPVASQPTLVVGAGIPREWLNQPMSVKGLVLGDSVVDWAWDGNQIKVQIQGKKINVRPGNAFPKNTLINVVKTQKPV
jgi:hypothetical protein